MAATEKTQHSSSQSSIRNKATAGAMSGASSSAPSVSNWLSNGSHTKMEQSDISSVSKTLKTIRLVQAYCGKDWTMPTQQLVVILLVMQYGELSLTEIKDKTHLSQPSGTRALDYLQGHGLIETWIHNRHRMVGLSPQGKTLMQEIIELA